VVIPPSKGDDPTATLPDSANSLVLAPPRLPSVIPPAHAGWLPAPSRSIPAPPPAPAEAAPAAPGTVLGGKYRIENILGTGGISVVAAAYDIKLRRRVAIKYLLVEALECPEIVERFTREARAAARIRGEHVARVIDVGTFDGGAPYIVLEHLVGEDLEAYLKRRHQLSIRRAIRYVLQTCEALAEAHAAKIVHRDLKPSNLFLAKAPDRQRRIKVLDFGVSKIVDEPMTDKWRMLGTAIYMSPEQLRAACEVDLRTDIWSLGVILYELLAGIAPFTGPTIVSVAEAIGRNAPRRLTELRRDVPEALEAVVMKCMQTDPEDRYASVLEVAIALAPFADPQDRESIRRISGVLQGSIAPPPHDLQAGFGDILALRPLGPPRATMPSVEVEVATAPTMLPPTAPPVGSDAPMVTPVDATDVHPIVSAAARPRPPWVWISAAAAAAFALTFAGYVMHGSAAAVPTDVTIRMTSQTPGARARIDDGPPMKLPLEMHAPRDHRSHAVRIEADGFVPQTATVRFETDVVFVTSLAPGR
jgi:eukaryotic-like serine/threonine-protein kinase